jgi:hypothetical protein
MQIGIEGIAKKARESGNMHLEQSPGILNS